MPYIIYENEGNITLTQYRSGPINAREQHSMKLITTMLGGEIRAVELMMFCCLFVYIVLMCSETFLK